MKNVNFLFTLTVFPLYFQSRDYCVADTVDFAGWIGLCSVLRPCQHSIGYMRDGFVGQKPNQQYQCTEGKSTKENQTTQTTKYT